MKRTRIPDDELQYRDRTSEQVRGTLLKLAFEFVEAARRIPGVLRIAMLGSLVTDKSRPKDADVLVTVSDDVDLAGLARAGRRFQGRAQGINSTADIFLADFRSQYIGRICHYRECFPRVRCHARNCGVRQHLNDDLDVISLDQAQTTTPALVVFPAIQSVGTVPNDVVEQLMRPLDGSGEATTGRGT